MAPTPLKYQYYYYLMILAGMSLPPSRHDAWPSLLLSFLVLLLGASIFIESAVKKINTRAILDVYWIPVSLIFLVAVWAAIQASSISLSVGDTAIRALFTFSLAVFFINTVLLHQDHHRVRTTLMVIVLAGTAQALYGSFMVLSGLEYGLFAEKTAYRGVATGTFYNRNHLAGFLEMSLACGIGLLVSTLGQDQRSNWRAQLRAGLDALLGPKMRLRVFLAFMVIALILTRSRMGNTAFFSSLIICSGLYMIAERRINWGAIILFTSLMLVDFLIVGQWFGFDELAERLESTSTQTEQRDEVARDTVTLLQANLITGYGLGTYYTVFPLYQGKDVRAYYDHAHNDYLEFASELGLVGFIPLVILVLTSAWMGLSSLFRRRNRTARGAGFAAFMSILSILIHATVEFNLQITANAQLFVFLLAMGWMSARQGWPVKV